MAVHPSEVQWEALELREPSLGALATLGGEVLFVNSEATLRGDSQEYLGRGACYGTEVRRHLGAPLILGALFSERHCGNFPWEFPEILGEDLFVN